MRKIFFLLVLFVFFLFSASSLSAQKNETIRVGYIPIMGMQQHLVASDQGWYDELSVSLQVIRFPSGPPMVAAFENGSLDVAFVGINPALVMASRDIPIKVVTANVTNAVSIIANKDFVKIWEDDPGAGAFAAFEARFGYRPTIATLPQGSTPDTLLRLWLNNLGLSTDDVELVAMGVQQIASMLEIGRVDAAVIMEPIISLATQPDAGYQIIVPAGQLLELQPTAVLVVSEDLIENNPELVQQLVEIHVRATQYANADLEDAARIASEQIGEADLPYEIALAAAGSRFTNWISDPHIIFESTSIYNEFQVELGIFEDLVDLDNLFDFTFYDAVLEEHPDWADDLTRLEDNPDESEEDGE